MQPAPILQPGESAAVPEPPDTETEPDAPGVGPDEPSNTGTGPDGVDPEVDPAIDPDDAGSDGDVAQPSPAVANANANRSDGNGRGGNNNPGRDPQKPNESGVTGGLVPWLLIGLGVAAAGAGGITFYLIRAASREPY